MKDEKVLINGISVEIENEKNLLELIRKAGVELPTFCYHPDLSVYGACRMCMVENERGMLEAACHTPARPGASYKTNTARLRKYRKMILELLLANHCRDCTTCEKSGQCKLQEFAKRYNIEGVRFPNTNPEPITDTSSLSIVKDNAKCILCGECVRVCKEIQNVGAIDFSKRGSKLLVSTPFNIPMAESACVGCGQCAAVCPTGALVVRNDTAKVWDALADEDTKVTIEIAPAVRVAIGKELGLDDGENAMGKIVTALRNIGFDAVYDTSTAADLTVLEEGAEFLKKVKNGEKLPLFTSCCPAWIRYCEKNHPELLPLISTCRSPMQMFASVIKELNKDCGKKHVHIAVMPCTAKKFEAARDEFKTEAGSNVDYVLTTKEFVKMVKESNIVFSEIQPSDVDSPFEDATGAGVIFGTTGGVTEAVLRMLAGVKASDEMVKVTYKSVRGNEGIREAYIPFGDAKLHIAIVSGLANAEKLIKSMEDGEHYDFVEVMACPGGCVNGGGQPMSTSCAKAKRKEGLYDADEKTPLRNAEDNPVMKKLYDGVLKGKTHELLHVSYIKK